MSEPLYNFNAGPSMLPREVVEETARACLDFNGSGLSLMEIPHRSAEFKAVLQEARDLVRTLLDVPQEYDILFLSGGARMEFCRVPYNFLHRKAAYLDTGTWAYQAMQEASHFGEVVTVASSRGDHYTYIPQDYSVPEDADYFHFTSNNTIYGTELRREPEVSVPLISDMSSDILSRPVEVSRYACIYAGAQKNLSMAGVNLVIVRRDALQSTDRYIPMMLNYQAHVEADSMLNTPPVLPIYTALLNLRWLHRQGGVEEMNRRAQARAAVLYEEIGRNRLFHAVAQEDSRSLMNICFVMEEEFAAREQDFLKFAEQRGIQNIRGHRSVGGFRASCYNAMPLEGALALQQSMRDFEQQVLAGK